MAGMQTCWMNIPRSRTDTREVSTHPSKTKPNLPTASIMERMLQDGINIHGRLQCSTSFNCLVVKLVNSSSGRHVRDVLKKFRMQSIVLSTVQLQRYCHSSTLESHRKHNSNNRKYQRAQSLMLKFLSFNLIRVSKRRTIQPRQIHIIIELFL